VRPQDQGFTLVHHQYEELFAIFQLNYRLYPNFT